MKMYWFNDTNAPIRIFWDMLYPQNKLIEIEPQRGVSFDVPLPEGQALGVKQWPSGSVLMWGTPT